MVCGMKFGSMGEPYVFVYKDQEIKVCDKYEKAGFGKDPDKYMKKLADAEAKMEKEIMMARAEKKFGRRSQGGRAGDAH